MPAYYSQAMDHCTTFPTLPLPLLYASQQVEEGLFGVRHVTIRRPAQELELADDQLTLLQLCMDEMGEKERSRSVMHRQLCIWACLWMCTVA